MAFIVEHDLKQLKADLDFIGRQAIPGALRMSQNKVLRSVRAHAQKSIANETGIKQKTIKSKMIERPATKSRYIAELDAKPGKAYNLIANVAKSRRKPGFFNKRFKSGKRKGEYRAGGVVANAWRSRKEYKGTFIINSRRGPLVVSRKGNKLKPIMGPSIRETFIKDKSVASMQLKVRERMPIEFERAFERERKKIKSRFK